MKLFLVGLPGSGKSTLGKQLAEHLNLPFIDMDEVIETQAQQPIRDIFAHQGESYFRSLERQTLIALIDKYSSFVIATGGGAPCFLNNMELMNQEGKTLFVDTPIPVIAKRMLQQGIEERPLLQQLKTEDFERAYQEKFAHRLPYYQQALFTVNPEDELSMLLEQLKS